MSSPSNTKRTYSIRDTPDERWSRLYIDVRAGYGRAAIQAALFLNGGASVALLAFLGNLAIAHQARGVTGSYATFKAAFVCFGIGVMLAASSNVIAFLIQNVAIAHPKEAEGRFARRLNWHRNGSRLAYSFRRWNDRGGRRFGKFGSVVGYRRLSAVSGRGCRARVVDDQRWSLSDDLPRAVPVGLSGERSFGRSKSIGRSRAN